MLAWIAKRPALPMAYLVEMQFAEVKFPLLKPLGTGLPGGKFCRPIPLKKAGVQIYPALWN